MRARFVCVLMLGSLLAARGTFGDTASADEPLRVAIIDGQNNHDWKSTTPILKRQLEDSGLFQVEVFTSPPAGADMSAFEPPFQNFAVVVSNYNGEPWSSHTRAALVDFVRQGGGFVAVHAANNAFPDWPEYNEMIGLGGWGGRTELSGPYLRLRDGTFVRDETPGSGGSHGEQHAFLVVARDSEHPIMSGLPASWMHATDELYDRLRGPAANLTVLATAYADESKGGSGEHEPMLMVIDYGEGRVFHTTLGHSPLAMNCVGFSTTFVRGTEWAATGKVSSQPLPADFPTADEVRVRE